MPDLGRVLSALTVTNGRRRDPPAGLGGAGGRGRAGPALASGPVADPRQAVLTGRPADGVLGRALALLPAGTVEVGAGLAVLGAGS